MSTGTKKAFLILGIILGAILSLGSIWALFVFVRLIANEVARIDALEAPRTLHLEVEIARALNAVMPGIIATPLGVALLVFCTVGLQRLRKPAATSPTPPEQEPI